MGWNTTEKEFEEVMDRHHREQARKEQQANVSTLQPGMEHSRADLAEQEDDGTRETNSLSGLCEAAQSQPAQEQHHQNQT